MRLDEEDRKQLVQDVVEALEPRFQAQMDVTLKLITDLREDMNKRFERMDKRFETLVDNINVRFRTLTDDMNRRFERLEKRMDGWEAKLTDVRLEFYRELSRAR